MPRRNFLLTLAYDGAGFRGWQRQPGDRTVQGEVESVLSELLGEPIEVTGAGRTDAGVHAEGQAASFHSRAGLSCSEIVEGLEAALPSDIQCGSCREVDPRFHARFRAKSKTYRYRLLTGKDPGPEARLRGYWTGAGQALSLDAMRDAAAVLGRAADLGTLSNAKRDGREAESGAGRGMDAIRIEEGPGRIDLHFTAPGFLTNQVRIMAAVLLEAGRGKLSPSALEAILSGGRRSAAPGMLPPGGLCLMEVRY